MDLGAFGEARSLRAQEGGFNGVVVRKKAKRFQFTAMNIDFQNGQKKCQHGRDIDEER